MSDNKKSSKSEETKEYTLLVETKFGVKPTKSSPKGYVVKNKGDKVRLSKAAAQSFVQKHLISQEEFDKNNK